MCILFARFSCGIHTHIHYYNLYCDACTPKYATPDLYMYKIESSPGKNFWETFYDHLVIYFLFLRRLRGKKITGGKNWKHSLWNISKNGSVLTVVEWYNFISPGIKILPTHLNTQGTVETRLWSIEVCDH